MGLRPLHHFLQVFQGDVGMKLCAGDPRVAQDPLNVAEAPVATEHPGGHRVAAGPNSA